MPAPTRSLTLDAVHEFVHERIFTPGGAGNVGIELEWFPPPRTPPSRLRELLPDPLPGRERGHVRARWPARAERPARARHRRRVHPHARRHRRRTRRAARVRHRARGHRARSARRAPACRRRPAVPRDGDVLRHPLAARAHDDAQHGIGAGERRHGHHPRRRERALEARARSRAHARGGVRQLSVRRVGSRDGLALGASRGLGRDRSVAHRRRQPTRHHRAPRRTPRTRSTRPS